MSIHARVRLVEKQNPGVVGTASWEGLKNFIKSEFPVLLAIQLRAVYRFTSKGRERRVVVTKENPKTWVMYETNDSSQPGMRWMIGKTWTTEENIYLDKEQVYELPQGLKLK